MVTRNEPALGLVNGDVGIVLPLPVGPGRRGAHRDIGSGGDGGHDPGLRRAAFLRADGSLVRWPVARLPAVETAFATSVHKAQGSEFDRVTLVLPSPWQRPCTRELVYTAVTRARRHVTVVADEASLRASIAMRTERLGGLRVRLDEARLR
jgi:exodeoxyribonuclease V alpha subunit